MEEEEEVQIRELRSDDDCSSLRLDVSEDKDLVVFLREDAKKLHDRMITKTHVVADGKKILAYVSVTCTEISLRDEKGAAVRRGAKLGTLFRRLNYDVQCLPGIRLARLASDKDCRGKDYRYGRKLMALVMKIARDISNKCGCRFILLDAVKDKIDYYKKYGFELIETNDNLAKKYPTMFLDLENNK